MSEQQKTITVRVAYVTPDKVETSRHTQPRQTKKPFSAYEQVEQEKAQQHPLARLEQDRAAVERQIQQKRAIAPPKSELPAPSMLYRAAPIVEPHFGRGSYWTPSLEFAQLFKKWLADTRGGEHEIYQAEVDLTDVHQLRGRRFSDIVTASVPLYADEGHQWLSFLERGSLDGIDPALAALTATERQYVYLGDEPIVAVVWES